MFRTATPVRRLPLAAALFLALAAARPAAGSPAAPAADAPATPCAQRWQGVLDRHAESGGLDYAALAAARGDLDAVLTCIAGTDPSGLARDHRVAFLVNAYNALVAAAVVERYPGIRSVRDVDGFFDRETHQVSGGRLTLDAVEEAARELDPRVHFAVVCASRSCPDLRGEAFEGGRIGAQLEEQTRRFLADREKGLRYDPEAGALYLSSIFKWYAGDFTGGSSVVAFFARGGILDWVVAHLGDRRLARRLEADRPAVRYLDYDWSLNDR